MNRSRMLMVAALCLLALAFVVGPIDVGRGVEMVPGAGTPDTTLSAPSQADGSSVGDDVPAGVGGAFA